MPQAGQGSMQQAGCALAACAAFATVGCLLSCADDICTCTQQESTGMAHEYMTSK
jgi:hypothetical protein